MHQTNYTTTCTASNCQHSNKPAIIQSILAQLVTLGLFCHLFWKRTVLQCFDALGWPVKLEWCGAGMAICLERGAGLHTAQSMLLPLTISCSSKIQIGFYLSDTGSPG